jgi:hypothetical protein
MLAQKETTPKAPPGLPILGIVFDSFCLPDAIRLARAKSWR